MVETNLNFTETGVYPRSVVADYFDVNNQTISNWIEYGVLCGVNLPGKKITYITGKSILNFIDIFPDATKQLISIKNLIHEIKTKQEALDTEYKDLLNELISLGSFDVAPGLDNNPIVKVLMVCAQYIGEPERNIEMFNLFIRGNTLNEIADTFQITRERVRQIVLKIQKLIRHYLVNCANQNNISEELEEAKRECKRLKIENNNLRNQIQNEDLIENQKDFGDTLLWELKENFSVRLQNCLGLSGDFDTWFEYVKDNNMSTVKELVDNWTMLDLLKLRNFGKKSLNELQNFLTVNNFTLRVR